MIQCNYAHIPFCKEHMSLVCITKQTQEKVNFINNVLHMGVLQQYANSYHFVLTVL